jgi:P-type Cu2+ transporter
MNHPARDEHGQASDPHAGHKMADMQGGHDRHAGHSVAMFRDKFWLSFVLTIPVVVWSNDVQRWFGYTAPSFPGSKLVPAVLGTGVFIYAGLVFIRGAQRELADHQPGMMTLISLGIMVAFGTSLAATLGFFEIEVWWELATLITIMVLGHWLEMRAISQASGALDASPRCCRTPSNALLAGTRSPFLCRRSAPNLLKRLANSTGLASASR